MNPIKSQFNTTTLLGNLPAGAAILGCSAGFRGTGELFPEGVALVPAGPSSQEEVELPDSSSEDKVGG